MADSTYANFIAEEGTVTGDLTVTLARKSRKVTITNDSSTNTLLFKFNSGEDYGTLNPTETVSLEFITKRIYLSSMGADYRIWVSG